MYVWKVQHLNFYCNNFLVFTVGEIGFFKTQNLKSQMNKILLLNHKNAPPAAPSSLENSDIQRLRV